MMLRWAFLFFLALSLTGEELKLQVLATSDLHGVIAPQDPFTLQPTMKGWAKLAPMVRKLKAEHPLTLLLDCGDTIQGEPHNYVRNVLKRELPEPSIAVMNALGYHAMVVGNHEFDFGLEVLREVEKQAKFPFLAGNVLSQTTKRPAFLSFHIQKLGPLKVGIVGFTTPWTPRWNPPEAIPDLEFTPIVPIAKTLVQRLREKDKVDLVIAALHMGLGESPGKDEDEDQALRLIDQVPGVDLVLTAHTHQLISTRHRQIPVLQPGAKGRALARAVFSLSRSWNSTKIQSVAAETLPIDPQMPEDPEVMSLTQAVRAAGETYLNTYATRLETDLDGRWCRMEDTPVMQLLHAAQRAATQAQLSAATPPPGNYFVARGPTSVRQFYALMPFENRLCVISLNGRQLKLYLEHAARHFRYCHEADLFNPAVPHWQFDLVDGVSYALDLSRPLGERIQNLSFQGQPVKPDQVFTMALSSYRVSGGGGYMEAIGFKEKPLQMLPGFQRNYLLKYILARPSLSVPVTNAWRTIPALDRERVMRQVLGNAE